MSTSILKIFYGRWRSFKTFKYSGTIKLNTTKRFTEFNFLEDGTIKIKEFNGDEVDEAKDARYWETTLENKRHYLHIRPGQITFEVITINHTVMILLDPISSDKIFFARDGLWHSFLQSNLQPYL